MAHAAWAAATTEGDTRASAVAATMSSVSAVETAVKATEKAVEGKSGDRPSVDVADCSEAAKRAQAAASAAKLAAEAAHAGHGEAARLQAAVAVLAAADAVTMVVENASQSKGREVPAVVVETEEIAASARVSVWWQIIPYVVITAAEICISVVGLELAFAAAPTAMKSFVTACFLLSVFFGDLLNAQIAPLYNTTVLGWHLGPGPYFAIFAAVMVPVTLAFLLIARQFNRASAAV
jgi:hypothetical protein